MTTIVCGGRDFNDRSHLFTRLDEIHAKEPIAVLRNGGARGADQLSSEWATLRGVRLEEFKANWGRYGASAGPIRNQQMLEYVGLNGRPFRCIAFPGGRGTAHMVRQSKKAGLVVIEVEARAAAGEKTGGE